MCSNPTHPMPCHDTAGHQLGSILSLLLSPPIISTAGWPTLFYLYGIAGFLALAAWRRAVPLPREQSAAGRMQPQLRWRDVPWRGFARSPVVWALAASHAAFGICYNVANAWLPSYFAQAYGVDIRSSAALAALPFAAMAVTTNASGWLADRLINRGVASTTRVRKAVQAAGAGVPALCLLHLAHNTRRGGGAKPPFLQPFPVASSGGLVAAAEARSAGVQARLLQPPQGAAGAAALLTAVLAGLGLQAGGYASTHSDVASRFAGVLFGTTNCCASAAGFAAVAGVGVLLDAGHGWSSVFSAVAWAQVVGLVVYLGCSSSAPLFD